MVEVPYNFRPREYQLPLLSALDSGIRRAVVIWPRRHGKDKCMLNWCIRELALEPKICYYCLPEREHARKVIWDAIDNDGFPFLGHFHESFISGINKSELKITFNNNSIFQLVGSDNYDRLVGANPKIVVFSEYGITNPRAWDFLRPILEAPGNNGTAVFIGTPRGGNHFEKLFRMARTREDWFAEILTNDDTHLLSDADMERLRAEGMSEELIQQEFYCSFQNMREGSYYGRYIKDAEGEGRIGDIAFDPNLLVYTAWDIGRGDSTSIVFFQIAVDGTVRVIDHYENRGYAVSHYVDEILSRKYTYGLHFLPHDAGHGHVVSEHTFAEICEQKGLNTQIIPNTRRVDEGIEIVRGMFYRMYFDREKCAYLISCLTDYHSEYDEKRNVQRPMPVHNWASHSSDSFRYMCLAIKDNLTSRQHSSEWSKIKEKYNYYADVKAVKNAPNRPFFAGN